MSLLTGITGIKSAASAVALDKDVASAFGAEALSGIERVNAQLETATGRLSSLLDTSAAIDAISPEDTKGRQLARFMVGQQLTDLDLSDEQAMNATAGLESESTDVGLEAWSSIKEFVVKIIEWVQKKWKELKRFVAKYFNKYFGDIERLQKAWTSVLEQAKDKQGDYTLEKNAKHEFEKGADYFYTTGNSVVEGKALATEAAKVQALAETVFKDIADVKVEELEASDILNADGTAVDFDAGTPFTFKGLRKLTSVKTVADTKYVRDNATSTRSETLLGRTALHLVVAENPKADTLASLKAFRLGMGDVEADQKKKTKANMALVDASTVESIADANLELLEIIQGVKRAKGMEKQTDSLDKAEKALDKWKKDVPNREDDGADKVAAYREAVKIATEYFSSARRTLISAPLEFCNYARTVSAMQKDFCTRSLKAHSKN